MAQRVLPAIIVCLMTIAALLPGVRTVPQHGDEADYALIGTYYGGRVARLDFSPVSRDVQVDPGWSPTGIWALTQPMGTRLLYAAVLGATGLPAPTRQWDYLNGAAPEAMLTPDALLAVRLAAILCAALGLAAIALRLRWRACAATFLFLLIPHIRADLTRGWAEGPLLLGCGLCVLAFGTRWFGVACGLAATAKLTALGFWPLLFWPRSTGVKRWASIFGFGSACAVWAVLTPPAWFAGGPVYLPLMIVARLANYADQSSRVGLPSYEGVGGFFLPTRYLLPIEYAGLFLLVSGAVWLWQRRPVRLPARQLT
jgi:hypothetical protein